MKGVLNLRGTIVPIVDLRKKFSLPEVDYTQFTVIVVVQVQGKTMGFIVDAVSDVLTVTGDAIQPTPDLHGQLDTSFLTGLAPTGERGEKLVILLDIDKVLTARESRSRRTCGGRIGTGQLDRFGCLRRMCRRRRGPGLDHNTRWHSHHQGG